MTKLSKRWSRRKFLAVSGAAAAQTAATLKGIGQTGSGSTARGNSSANEAIPPRSRPPEVISGGIQPLLEGHTARPLRYKPGTGEQAGEFVIRNGSEFFNRPIYGPPDSGGFRVDAGDKPEFSLYLPGHGGNLKLGFIVGDASKWGADADEVVARYRPGRMIYEIRDALLAKGMIRAELLTAGEGSGLLLKVEGSDLPAEARLAWAFGGVSGRKGRRGGDIGCEVEPVSQFFQVRAEECDGNRFQVKQSETTRPLVRVSAAAANFEISFPRGSSIHVEDFANWSKSPGVAMAALPIDVPGAPEWKDPLVVGPDGQIHVKESKTEERRLAGQVSPFPVAHPILTGSAAFNTAPLYLVITRDQMKENADSATLPLRAQMLETEAVQGPAFAARSAQVEAIAQSIRVETPDEYINAAGPALAIAADALWDAKQGCIMHGAVAWRQAFAGWRGPYALDALGTHDRAVANFRHWIAKQNKSPITTGDPATGPWDANVHLTRKEKLLHSNGDVENSHYDMNLVLFDALLRHLMWTGDLDFAREVWPAFQRQLAWEHRLFRRTFRGKDGTELPLYEAYAAIWASDNLQYSGGGAAHSSAYMVFALRGAAKIAPLIDWDGTPYTREADLIARAMNELLWLPEQGAFGESKDLLGPQTVYSNPALWTVYHTIDSEAPTAQQARQMCAERLAALKHVPIHGEGVPDGSYMLACSDWLPYMWSLNLLLLAENTHFALALWQAGMRDDAYKIFKGALLDSMYMGLCPGDLHMTSALDVHRQEAQRDFGDPIGITSRALIEGLFGIQPDLLAGEVRIMPGFPSAWDRASIRHKDFDFAWRRDGLRETYEFTSRLAKEAALKLRLPARTTSLPVVTSNGQRITGAFDSEAAGEPMLNVTLPAARSHRIAIAWHGHAYQPPVPQVIPRKVFETLPVPPLPAGAATKAIDLSGVMKNGVTEIFTRLYAEPRSQYCSLSFPDNLLGGWANPDGRATVDDAGLRAAAGVLKTVIGVDFATPAGDAPNCLFLSYWKQDEPAAKIALRGRASGMYLLMTGTTMPQCSRMTHATVTVTYRDGSSASLPLRNPETWWPIEQDYLLDDYLFVNDAPLPPRVDLRSGQTRVLDIASFKGKGRNVPGGAATILHLPLDPKKELAAMEIKVELYGVVVGLMGATLVRA